MLTHELLHTNKAHATIASAIFERVDYALQKLAPLVTQYRANDELFNAYVDIPEDEETDSQKKALNDDGRPEYRTVVIPYSYAMVMTLHTYLSTVFLSRNPVFQWQARDQASKSNEQAVESLIEYQLMAGKAKPILFNWIMDPLRSGVGIVNVSWKKEVGTVAAIRELIENGKTKKVLEASEVVTFEGNKLSNVRLIDAIVDPRYGFTSYQNGEFYGELSTVSSHVLTRGVRDGLFIEANVKKVLDQINTETEYSRRIGSTFAGMEKDLEAFKHITGRFGKKEKSFKAVDVIEFYWKLVPKDYGLGDIDSEVLYYILMSSCGTILAIRPLGAFHNMFPAAINTFDIDLYKYGSRAALEIFRPMEETLNYLLNQHFYNVRKHLNNNSIIDPSKLVLRDLYNRNPGGYIRLKPNAYGSNPSESIYQMQSTDITRAHLTDVRMMEEFAQRIGGVNDNIMGMVNPGGRKTAQEVRMSSSFSTNRIKTLGEWQSCTGWDTLASLMLKNSQQYLSQTSQVRIAGPSNGPAFMDISPEAIAGMFDYVPVDGTMPLDRQATAQILQQMLPNIMQGPMAQQYDIGGLFSYIARLAGAGAIERFKVQVLPDAQAMGMAQGAGMQPIQGNPNARPI